MPELGITLNRVPCIFELQVRRGQGPAVPGCPSLLPHSHVDHVGEAFVSSIGTAPAVSPASSLNPGTPLRDVPRINKLSPLLPWSSSPLVQQRCRLLHRLSSQLSACPTCRLPLGRARLVPEHDSGSARIWHYFVNYISCLTCLGFTWMSGLGTPARRRVVRLLKACNSIP